MGLVAQTLAKVHEVNMTLFVPDNNDLSKYSQWINAWLDHSKILIDQLFNESMKLRINKSMNDDDNHDDGDATADGSNNNRSDDGEDDSYVFFSITPVTTPWNDLLKESKG